MSEKRFTSNERWIAEGTIVDICDNGKVIMQVFDDDNIQNVVDLLNEQQATIDKQDKAIREALKVLADSKNYQSVISFKYGLQYATKLLKRVIDDE